MERQRHAKVHTDVCESVQMTQKVKRRVRKKKRVGNGKKHKKKVEDHKFVHNSVGLC